MPADLLLGREVTHTSKVVKQADVVMLCHVLPDEIGDEVARANYDYYEPITVHGSSLSPGIHAAVAARLGNVTGAMWHVPAWPAAIDLADNMGNAARGLHMATMGGLWQAAVMGFGGVRRRGEALRHRPAPAARRGSGCAFRCASAARGLRSTAAPQAGDDVGITVEEAPRCT